MANKCRQAGLSGPFIEGENTQNALVAEDLLSFETELLDKGPCRMIGLHRHK
jgi:hypothetical protein